MDANRIITRQGLYDLVWKIPMIELGKQFRLSDNGLRKICKKHAIPLPEIGYWQKLKSGKPTHKIPLPASNKDGAISIAGSIANEKDKAQPIFVLEGKVEVPDHIEKFHPLINQTKQLFTEERKDKGRFITARGKHALDIRVGPQQIKRAYRIMDTILKELEKRGAHVGITSKDEWSSRTYAEINGEKVSFGLDETLKTIIVKGKYSWGDSQEFEPNGKLLFRINDNLGGNRGKWTEGKGKLEDKLSSFINGLFFAAAYLKKDRQERAEQTKKWEEERLERESLLKAQEEEKQRFEILEKQAESWQKSRLLRAFVRAAVRKVKTYEPDSKFDKWIKWAETKAAQLDPLKELHPPNQ